MTFKLRLERLRRPSKCQANAPFLTTERPGENCDQQPGIVRLPVTRATFFRSSFSMRSCRTGERTPDQGCHAEFRLASSGGGLGGCEGLLRVNGLASAYGELNRNVQLAPTRPRGMASGQSRPAIRKQRRQGASGGWKATKCAGPYDILENANEWVADRGMRAETRRGS